MSEFNVNLINGLGDPIYTIVSSGVNFYAQSILPSFLLVCRKYTSNANLTTVRYPLSELNVCYSIFTVTRKPDLNAEDCLLRVQLIYDASL